MRSSPKALAKALFSVAAALCGLLGSGMSALAADIPVQVSAQLTGNTVSVTGTVQEEAVTRVGVLILEKDADLDAPGPEDIVYVNEYELGAEKAFSFSAELPEADLQQYILRIGGDNGLLYQRLLDGSEIPAPSGTTAGEPSATEPEPGETTASSAESGETSPSSSVSGETTASGTAAETEAQPTSSAPAAGGDGAQTGDGFQPALWITVCASALLVMATVVLLKKKEGAKHE